MSWLPCILSNVLLATLLALLAVLAQRWLRLHAVARILWVLVLIKLVTPPLVSLPVGESSGSLACALGTCGCPHHAGSNTAVFNALAWVLLAVWSAGAAATAWTAWRRWACFQQLLSHASPAPAEWQSLSARLAAELSIWRRPEVLAVPGRLSPMVVAGWRQPRMLVPEALIGRLNASQREALLLHELVHLKRGDHWVRMLELAVAVVYWWLPIVGSIGRQLRTCEETCCDAAVVAQLPQARREYAQLLLDVVDFADPLPRQAVPQGTAMSAVHDLEQRLRGILDTQQMKRRTWPAGAVAVGLACAILPCELHYDLLRQPATAAITSQGEPAAGAARSPSGKSAPEPISVFCCPS